MIDEMSIEEFHEYQATGKMPFRFLGQSRSRVLDMVAKKAPELLDHATEAMSSPPEYRPGPALTISEKAFQSQVEQAARASGWYAYHTYSSRRSEPGFPDLVLVNPTRKRTVFAELKTEKGSVSDHQKRWLWALKESGQEAYLWRPSMWSEIEAVLTRR